MTDHPATARPAPRRTGELVGIQYLRGIAALMVVVYHVQAQIERMGYAGPWPQGLSGGVDIFFVISGFIMWVTTCGKPIGPLGFWERRITRIVPLYWIITTFMAIMMILAPNAFQSSRFAPGHVLASYLFVAAHHPVKQAMEPVVMPGWTLNYEMFFYFVFGLCLTLAPRLRFWATAAALAALVAAGAAAGAQPVSIAGFYTSSIMLEFAMGMAIGLIATRDDVWARGPAWAGAAMVAIGLIGVAALLGTVPGPRVLLSGVPAAAVVAGALVLEAHGRVPQWRLLRAIGDASYSIYLSHLVVQSASSQLWRKLHLDHHAGGWIGYGVVSVVLSAAFGWLVYRYVEKPLIALFRSRPRAGVKVHPAKVEA